MVLKASDDKTSVDHRHKQNAVTCVNTQHTEGLEKRVLLLKGFLARVGFQAEYKYSLVSSCCPLTLISNSRVHSVPTIATQLFHIH